VRRWSVSWSRAAVAFLLAALFVVGSSACSGEATHEFAGAVLESPEPLPDFTLTSADGPVSLSDFRGQYVFLYFGYMFCPDFCPTTMSKLARVHRELGDDAERMQVIMVSVDPERDTPEALAKYAAAFNPEFMGITGSKEEIDRTGEPYGLYYQRNEGSAATGYLVDHSTRTFLIGPDGRALVAYPHDAPAEGIVADLQWLLKQESQSN
jgi:protein SCO1/2